jgi:hypothetical protein
MSKPDSNRQKTSWMERMIAKLRGSFESAIAVARRLNPLHGPTMGVLACALLLVGISRMPRAGESSSKNGETLSVAAASEAKRKVAPAKAKQNRIAAEVQEKQVAKEKSTEQKTASTKNNEPGEYRSAGAREMEEVQLSPGGQAANGGEGAEENSDTVRARANWFFDQRAYPNQHIPPGALQEAIRQRDLMKQQQKARSAGQFGAQGIISFPGDALWHLMGPQPINEPASLNAGFPTASGRVTAIAVDPSDPNGNTVYIGAAAGGVWKTTNGGTSWISLTDSQPSLAVGSIAIDPNSCAPAPCTTIYVGTGEDNFNGDAFYGVGILKSTDGGNTWTQQGAANFAGAITALTGGAKIGAIAVQPGNPSVVLASVFFFDFNDSRGGVWQSLDGGATWHQPTAGGQGAAGTGVAFESTSVA